MRGAAHQLDVLISVSCGVFGEVKREEEEVEEEEVEGSLMWQSGSYTPGHLTCIHKNVSTAIDWDYFFGQNGKTFFPSRPGLGFGMILLEKQTYTEAFGVCYKFRCGCETLLLLLQYQQLHIHHTC